MNAFFATTFNSFYRKIFRTFIPAVLLVFSWAQSALAAESSHNARASQQVWTVSMDNDLFVPLASSDRDFTGGLAMSYSEGNSGGNSGGTSGGWRPLDGLLAKFDRAVTAGAVGAPATKSVELGFYGFTPNAIEQTRSVYDDRPYASLIYLSASRVYPLITGDSLSTALTLGVLGSDVVGDAQNALHQWIGNDPVEGWRNQISDGGELTARYHIAHHHYWNNESDRSRLKTTVFSSMGYLTEIGVALSTRRGLISSPDHRFNPELISYGERVNETAATPYQGKESYFWGGITLKARLYNAFLQGQFRHSAHTLDASDLRPLIAEAWLGYTLTIGHHYKASYVLRAQSSELEEGTGDRGHLWGGIVFSRYL